jgi:zinc transport system substrate-binding protein
MPVFVTIVPQAYFVERVGDGMVDVKVLTGPGQSPHTYEPTPRQVAALARSRIYFTVGVPMEKGLVSRLSRSFPGLRIVDTAKGVRYIYMDGGHDSPNNLHAEKGSSGKVPDPHIWLDPARVKIQAVNIRNALVETDPSHRALYNANLKAFLADLDRLDAELREVFAPLRGAKVYVFHPAFGYLADAYGFIQVPVELEGKEPGGRRLAELVRRASSEGVKVVFVQPQFSSRRALAVARQIGGAVVAIDPLPSDYMVQMREMARTIRDSLADG